MNLTSMAAAALIVLGSPAVAAQTVTFNGHIGTQKALLVIDGYTRHGRWRSAQRCAACVSVADRHAS